MLFHGSPPWIVSPWLKKWRFGGSAPNRANKTPFDSDAQSKRIKDALPQKNLSHWHSLALGSKKPCLSSQLLVKSSANKVPIERGKSCFFVHFSASQFKT
jgi:hypothetical protein